MKRSRNLIEAIEAGQTQSVRALLDQGADVNVRDESGMAPLHLAAFDGHQEMVVMLMSAGADVDASDRFGRTPLHHAVFGGHMSVVVHLLLHGADPHSRGSSGISALDLATLEGKQELASVLQLASDVLMKDMWSLARSLSAAATSRGSQRKDQRLVLALLEDMSLDARIEPLVTAALEEIRNEKQPRHPSISPSRGGEGDAQDRPVPAGSESRRAARFTGVPPDTVRIGRSWVISGSDPSINAGDIYAFVESATLDQIIDRAARELDVIAIEGSGTALDLFDEYVRRIEQSSARRADYQSPPGRGFHAVYKRPLLPNLERMLAQQSKQRLVRILNPHDQCVRAR